MANEWDRITIGGISFAAASPTMTADEWWEGARPSTTVRMRGAFEGEATFTIDHDSAASIFEMFEPDPSIQRSADLVVSADAGEAHRLRAILPAESRPRIGGGTVVDLVLLQGPRMHDGRWSPSEVDR